jgi:hypothetical protein
MNDTMSLLLATGILAVGGLGLFMYKSGPDDNSNNEKNNNMFDLGSYFGNSNDGYANKYNEDDYEYHDEDEVEYPEDVIEVPKRSRGSKTKSTRKNSGTKRRY